MAEQIENKKIFSLFEVSRSIQKTLAERYTSSYWIKAELHKLNHYTQSGHCYPELVEKKDGKTIAELRSIIWRDDFVRINNLFKKVLKEPLKDGITVLFCAKISFDPKYGLTLIISDIDPAYSLGELEKEKQQTIKLLKEEGMFDKNKKLRLPILPKRIAIISVATSKGYSDFLNIIDKNPFGYSFFKVLFPAVLQGEKAIESIMQQMARISMVKHHFDAIAIIRGGGGDVGLSCYNDHRLSRAIAVFPIPVFTGIGHSTNETVAELVAYRNAITPTELADMLLQKFHDFAVPVSRAEEIITDKATRILSENKLQLFNSVRFFKSVSKSMLIHCNNKIQNVHNELKRFSIEMLNHEETAILACISKTSTMSSNLLRSRKDFLHREIGILKKDVFSQLVRQRLTISITSDRIVRSLPAGFHKHNMEIMHIEKTINNLDPKNVLKRGYSITSHNGKLLTSAEKVKKGDTVITKLASGQITAEVKE